MLLTWLGHHSFRIEFGNKVIYLDPYAGEPEWYDKKANLILISKNDYDHWSRALVNRLLMDGTHLFGEAGVSREFYGCRPFAPNESITFEDNTRIEAKPAVIRRRNLTSTSLGWLLTIEGKTILFAGDTDTLPEKLPAIDVVLVPVGGMSTMKARDAAAAVKIIKPRLAIPTHYGRTSGTVDDAELFKELVESSRETTVLILEPGTSVTL